MAKKYMIGTLEDYPLLIVVLNDVKYFVDQKKKEVFEDKPKLPKVTDKDTKEAVLKAAKEL